MSELSNVLRQRLASREDPRVHPDPDSLTAYLEQLLPAAERDQLLEHLAVCRQCREIVALSLPEQPVPEDLPVVTVPVRRGWRAWIVGKPALGLAASLAGLAIVATLIVELPRLPIQKQSSQPVPFSASNNVTAAATPAPPVADAKQPEVTPPANSVSRVREAEPRAAAPVGRPQNSPVPIQAEPLTAAAPNAGDSSAGGAYVNTLMFANDAGNVVPPPSEAPSAPAPRIATDHQKPLSLSNNAQLTNADAPHQMQSSKPLRILSPATSANHFGLSMVTTIGRDAKQIFHRPAPAINGYAFASSAMGGAGQFNPADQLGSTPEVTAAAPEARDAPELEQSHALTARARPPTNGGRVDGATAGDGAARKAETAPSAWKVGDSKLLKLDNSGAWSEAYPSTEGIEFSVVSSHGSDIWAGGGNAALLHSIDGGKTWERITLGSSATGTILGIEASGLKVLVKSSSGQSWSSPDGGKTWVLQD